MLVVGSFAGSRLRGGGGGELRLDVQERLLRRASHGEHFHFDRPSLSHAMRAGHHLLLQTRIIQGFHHEHARHEGEVQTLRRRAIQEQNRRLRIPAKRRQRGVFPRAGHAHARDVLEVDPGGGEREVDHRGVRAKSAVHDHLRRRALARGTHPTISSRSRRVRSRRRRGGGGGDGVRRGARLESELRGAFRGSIARGRRRSDFSQSREQPIHLRGFALRLQRVRHAPRVLHVRRLNLDEILRHSLSRGGVIGARIRRLHDVRRRAHGASSRRALLVNEILRRRRRDAAFVLVANHRDASAA